MGKEQELHLAPKALAEAHKAVIEASGMAMTDWEIGQAAIRSYLLAARDEQAEVVGWRWRAKVKGEWGLWSLVEVDPNDWTWRDYWEDLEIRPLTVASHPAVAAGGVTEEMVNAAIAEEDLWDTGMVSRAGKPPVYFVARRDVKGRSITVSEHAQHFEAREAMERASFRAAITAALAVGDEGIREGWRHDPPFITSTSARPEYYVTVKVRDIKALHDAHDVVLRAFSEAVRLGGSNADQN